MQYNLSHNNKIIVASFPVKNLCCSSISTVSFGALARFPLQSCQNSVIKAQIATTWPRVQFHQNNIFLAVWTSFRAQRHRRLGSLGPKHLCGYVGNPSANFQPSFKQIGPGNRTCNGLAAGPLGEVPDLKCLGAFSNFVLLSSAQTIPIGLWAVAVAVGPGPHFKAPIRFS